jgi:hypothetical protein
LADSYLILNLELPESFLEDLYETINTEIALAQKKWKLKLTDEQKAIVFESARTQTRLKTSTIAKQPWDLGRKLAMKITFSRNTQIELKPGAQLSAANKKINLVLTKDGWVLANEESEYPVNVTDILEKQIETIKRWARTAAFYGVGSYSR